MTVGKKFEERFKSDWMRAFPNSILLRLADQQSGYYGTSRNPCDFIAFVDRNFFMIECKTHKGNTFPWSAFSQYDMLKSFPIDNASGSYAGVVVWMYDHEDSIFYLPIKTVEKMKADGLKSFNVIKHDFEKYPVIKIPSQKKRVFYESDYSILLEVLCQKQNLS